LNVRKEGKKNFGRNETKRVIQDKNRFILPPFGRVEKKKTERKAEKYQYGKINFLLNDKREC
jgi:hypothetical protein